MTEKEPLAQRTLRGSIENAKRNKLLILLVAVLGCVIGIAPSLNYVGKEAAILVVMLLLVKAESRQQPKVVVLLAVAVSACTVLAVVSNSGPRVLYYGLIAGLFVPLLFSNSLFAKRDQPTRARTK